MVVGPLVGFSIPVAGSGPPLVGSSAPSARCKEELVELRSALVDFWRPACWFQRPACLFQEAARAFTARSSADPGAAADPAAIQWIAPDNAQPSIHSQLPSAVDGSEHVRPPSAGVMCFVFLLRALFPPPQAQQSARSCVHPRPPQFHVRSPRRLPALTASVGFPAFASFARYRSSYLPTPTPRVPSLVAPTGLSIALRWGSFKVCPKRGILPSPATTRSCAFAAITRAPTSHHRNRDYRSQR